MKKEVSYRKKEEYMAETGQRIEEWKRAGTAEIEVEDEDYEVDEDVIYYGSAMIAVTKPQVVPNEQGGMSMAMVKEPKEIKFSIPGAKNVEEALQLFNQSAEDMFKQMQEAQEKAQRKQQSQIVTAPGAALEEIDRMQKIITD